MLPDITESIKQTVSMIDVCNRYGLPLNRAGFCQCPFHNERTASFKAYPGDKGFCCFGCHESGDVIDFVMRYFNLPFRDALARINEDFSLGFDLRAPLNREDVARIQKHKLDADTLKAFEQWKEQTINRLNDCCRLAFLAKKQIAPEHWSQPMVDAIKYQDFTEYYSDILNGNNLDAQIDVFRSRKEVRNICDKILNPLQTRYEQV